MKKLICIILCIATILSTAISAFATAGATAQTFSDVPTSHWAYSFIQWAYDTGAVSGTSYNEKTGKRRHCRLLH